ncbi:hypothetical protein FHR24_000729 [Wenyingzhuangia heitensis]|uniref:Outer membrane protein transport protein (OMPP1/FadL/TodX) n=1 Tax=Wenyingzhuangia heitensis TaxID=1487859 RepID=A0ABX0U934_9FLAO|nr:hypothetical protein [Wenyingzhuangia heitensis]NIJ44290.1 hypothetical protein [Wenyingzhuangia heitensis]
MKNILYILAIITFTGTQAQSLNYTDLGVLFSSESTIGTARFVGLNGAMGAVGGDLSATQKNPAGAAIFNHGQFSITGGVHNYKNSNNYYGSSTQNKSSDFNLDQIGGAFVFNDINSYSGWRKVVFSVNYQRTNNFYTRDYFEGNGGYASFYRHPNAPGYHENEDLDTSEHFENAQSQSLHNLIDGKSSKFSFSLAGQYNEHVYLGLGLNFHSLSLYQTTELNELNEDNTGYLLDGLSIQNNSQTADGFSINAGVILKPIHQLRLGLSIASPTWYYNVLEEYDVTELIANIPDKGINAADPYRDNSYLEYSLSTPSKLTASAAVVLGKLGFINIDYTYKVYNSLNLDGLPEFKDDNQYFTNALQNTNNIVIGAEIRLGNLNLRGGAGYEQSPFKENLDPNYVDIIRLGNKYSGSLGAGYRFGNSILDLAYRATKQNNEYDLYDGDKANPATIDNKNTNLSITYTYIF